MLARWESLRQLKISSRFTLSSFLIVIGLTLPALAFAGCTDPARPGVNWQGCFHNERPFVRVDITGANLRGAELARTDFSGSILKNVDARRAKFFSAKMTGVILNDANLTSADFTNADLVGASLINANLRSATLFRANLRGANLKGAVLNNADLLKADLSGATWVDGKTICGEGSVSRCN